MKTEQNQNLADINIKGIIVVDKIQRTGPDGKKLGYGFHVKDEMGVVIEISAEAVTYLTAKLDKETYMPSDIDKEYYFSISKGSEIEYIKKIDEEGEKQEKIRDTAQIEIFKLKKWRNDFEHSISFLGKMARFIKGFK